MECQLKDKDSQIHLKDHLINDLNEKILSNGLSGLNTKYKYLIKAWWQLRANSFNLIWFYKPFFLKKFIIIINQMRDNKNQQKYKKMFIIWDCEFLNKDLNFIISEDIALTLILMRSNQLIKKSSWNVRYLIVLVLLVILTKSFTVG